MMRNLNLVRFAEIKLECQAFMNRFPTNEDDKPHRLLLHVVTSIMHERGVDDDVVNEIVKMLVKSQLDSKWEGWHLGYKAGSEVRDEVNA